MKGNEKERERQEERKIKDTNENKKRGKFSKGGRKKQETRGSFGLGVRMVTRFVARLEPDGSEVETYANRISSSFP